MKALIVDDDFTSRLMLQEFMKNHGMAHIAVNGREAVAALRMGLEAGEPYDVICLDIMMPEMDGQATLREVRRVEEEFGISGLDGVKIIMTTALGDKENVMQSFRGQCDVYMVKPIDKRTLFEHLHALGVLA